MSLIRRNNPNISRHNSSSKGGTYGFTIAIIVGVFGLAIGAAGLAGYFPVSVLSHMTQLDVSIMIAAGGGMILLIIGTTVKNRKGIIDHQQGKHDIGHPLPLANTLKPIGALSVDASQLIDTQGVFYGPESWKRWNVDILDIISPAPTVDLSKKDKVLLYIPQRIRVDGKEQDLTLKSLKEITGGPFSHFSKFVEEHFGDKPALRGWVLIDKNVIPESRGKDYETQQKMAEERGCSMPSILEAVVLNLMVFAFTGERLYGKEPSIETRCLERVDGYFFVTVGGFSSKGLVISTFSDSPNVGVAYVRRNFSH